MELRPHRIIKRKKTRLVKVGNISVGDNSQISVQSMTNTLTTDIKSTIKHETHGTTLSGKPVMKEGIGLSTRN